MYTSIARILNLLSFLLRSFPELRESIELYGIMLPSSGTKKYLGGGQKEESKKKRKVRKLEPA